MRHLVVIVSIIVCFSSCRSTCYTKYTLEKLEHKDYQSNFIKVSKPSVLKVIEDDSIVTIKLNRKNIVYQNAISKKYYIYMYWGDKCENDYEGYECDSTMKVINHYFGFVVY